MDISTGWLKSDIHTWIYPWISISTASLEKPNGKFPVGQNSHRKTATLYVLLA